jgi:hypothetical protein
MIGFRQFSHTIPPCFLAASSSALTAAAALSLNPFLISSQVASSNTFGSVSSAVIGSEIIGSSFCKSICGTVLLIGLFLFLF